MTSFSNVIQYAHNSTVMIHYKTVQNLQDSFNQVSNNIEKYVCNRGIILNRKKTEIVPFGTDKITTLNFINSSHTVK